MSGLYDQVLHFAAAGQDPGQIAQTLGCHIQTVYGNLNRARNRGADLPPACRRGRKQTKRRAPVPPEVQERLEPFAAARGMTPVELAARIVEQVAQGNLVDAVLDDGVTIDV